MFLSSNLALKVLLGRRMSTSKSVYGCSPKYLNVFWRLVLGFQVRTVLSCPVSKGYEILYVRNKTLLLQLYLSWASCCTNWSYHRQVEDAGFLCVFLKSLYHWQRLMTFQLKPVNKYEWLNCGHFDYLWNQCRPVSEQIKNCLNLVNRIHIFTIWQGFMSK